MKKVFFIVLAFFTSSLLFSNNVYAEIINRETSRVYEVQDSSVLVKEERQIKVTQEGWFISSGHEEVFTIFNPVQNDDDFILKLQKTRESIKVTDNYNFSLDFTTELTENGNIILRVPLPIQINITTNYKISLEYTSFGLITKNGKLRDIYVPAFAEGYKFRTENSKETISTLVKVPKEFGEINFATPEHKKEVDKSFSVISFSQNSLIGETGWVQVGTEQTYSFKIKQYVKPTSSNDFTKNIYRILIPSDVDRGPISQRVFITNINKTPLNAFKDRDGNMFLEFEVLSNEDSEITIEGYAVLRQDNSVNFRNSGKLSDIPKDITEQNLLPAEYWEVTSKDIQDTANELKSLVSGEDKDIYELVNNTYKFVIDRIDYSEVKRFGINERQGALATLLGGAAVCMEYSDLFITLMRAQGVPARAAFGYGYSGLDPDTDGDNEKTINHQWAEVYFPNLKQWIAVDTTWGESGQELIGGDLNHFYTHVASISPNQPSTTEVEFYGNLDKVPDKEFGVEATEEILTEGKTLTQLISDYNSTYQHNQFETGVLKARILLFEVDQRINEAILSVIPNLPENLLNMIKLSPLLIISAVLVMRYFLNRKRESILV